MPAPGATTAWGSERGWTFPTSSTRTRSAFRSRAALRRGPGSPGSGSRPIFPLPPSSWPDAGSTGGPTCGLCAYSTSSPCSRPTISVRGLPSWPFCPISQSREVSELFVDEVMTETVRGEFDAATASVAGAGRVPELEVAVIGAGPHGLSAAVHLRRAGVAAQVFGAPMSFWRSMPKGMRLRSNMSATNLIEPVGPFSLASYMGEIGEQFGHPVSLRRFIDYGTWVQQNAIPDVDPRMVGRVTRDGARFRLELEDGEQVTARRVVVACGIAAFENVPPGF